VRSILKQRRAIVFAASLAACLAGGAHNRCCAAPAEAPLPPPGQGVFEARHTTGPITVDGVLDEADWSRAQPFALVDLWDKSPPGDRGPMYALWDAEYVYFACDFTDSDLYAKVMKHDGKTWYDDVFEVFLKPAEGETPYFELHITPGNVTMDLKVPHPGDHTFEEQIKWESKFSAAAHLKGTLNTPGDRDEGWTAEMRIPWAAFAPVAEPPKAGDRWLFAGCRYDYTAHEDGPLHFSTARFKFLGFHRTHEYDWLQFQSGKRELDE